MHTKKLSRRQFLKASALTAATAAVAPLFSGCETSCSCYMRPATSPNEEIRVAVIGFNGRGKDHLKGLRELKNVRVVALCDVDKDVLNREFREAERLNEKVIPYQDIRLLLENKDIDAVTIATPNHWHSLAAIWAIQAGKDVYVEKPVSHNIWEGRQLVKAARKHGAIVQTGTQCRSSTGLAQAVQWVQAGNIGKIKLARGLCYKRRASIGKTTGPQPTPPSVDYDLWTGPVAMEPLRRKKLHYDWHWVWSTGNGDIGNQGIHQMDIARWFLGEKELSPAILSVGGRLGYEDDGTTPNTLATIHDYPAAPLIFEVRGLPEKTGTETMDKYHGAAIGVIIECEHGSVVVPSYTEAHAYDLDGKLLASWTGSVSHFGNFIDAMRSRQVGELHADILEGHLSSGLCHSSNISYRLGTAMQPEQIREATNDNKPMAETLGRMQEHLAANGVDLMKTPLMLGAHLVMDPKAERFKGSKAANELVGATYRAPFVVPEKV
jgi:predicted dehydrogenase